jgi:glutaminyl-peptide cyclotransferase
LALLALGAGMGCLGCGGDEDADAAVPTPSKNRFDRDRAWRLLRDQVALGPRPAGSAASRRLAERLRRELPEGRFEAVPGGLRNVIGRLPGARPAIVIGAHYDTKDLPGFVGANDGASGVAVLVELARVLRTNRRRGAPELRFVLFDGEEAPRGRDAEFLRYGVRGSRAYVRAHRKETSSMILLDFVGDRDLSLPREAGSNPALWARLRAAAGRVGVGRVFPNRTAGLIFDDHTPFTRAGIPAIDLIDFDYPHFHTRRDTLDKVSRRSLDAVGEAVVEMVRGL